MSYEALLAGRGGRPRRIGLAGADEFGRSFVFRSGPAASAFWRRRDGQDERFFAA